MPITLTEDPSTYPPTVEGPAGAELRNSASVRAPLTTLANRAGWLKATLATLDAAFSAASSALATVVAQLSGGAGGVTLASPTLNSPLLDEAELTGETTASGPVVVGDYAGGTVPGALYVGSLGLATTGDIYVGKSVHIHDVNGDGHGLEVVGPVVFQGGAELGGDSTVPVADTLTVEGTLVQEGQLLVAGSGAIHAYSGSAVQIDAGASFGIGAAAASTGSISAIGAGRIRRRHVYIGDTNHVVLIADGDVFVATSISGTKTWDVPTTGALEDDEIRVVPPPLTGVSGTLVVDWVAGSMSFPNTGTNLGAFVDLVFRSGGWRCMGASSGRAGTGL